MKAVLQIVSSLVLVLMLGACGSPYYTAAPIEAWVVDAETGQPIEGAVVTANWQLLAGGLDTGGRKLRQLEVMETVTDKDGRFRFPGFTRLNISLDQLGEEDPQILVFKPGYQYYRATNEYPIGRGSPGPHRTASIDGKKLEMRGVQSDITVQGLNLDHLGTNLLPIRDSGDLTKIPRMIRAAGCERIRIKAIDPRINISVPGDQQSEKDCALR